MMTQSVMTQAARLFGNAAGSVTSKGKQTGSGFDLKFDSNLKTAQKVNENKALRTEETKTSDVTDKNADQANAAKTKTTAADNTKETDNGQISGTKKVKTDESSQTEESKLTDPASSDQTDTEKIGKAEDGTELTADEQLIAQLSGLLQSIKEVVMNMLQLSPEELDNLMAEQKIGLADLLQPESLQKLVLENSGGKDILAVLTDENLETSMKELLGKVEDLKNEADLPFNMEQIKSVLEQVEQQAKKQAELQQILKQDAEGSLKDVKTTPDNMLSEKEVVVAQAGLKEEQKPTFSQQSDKDETLSNISKPMETGKIDTEQGASKDNKGDSDLKSMDQFQMFVDNLTKVSAQNQVDFSGNMVQVTELRDIANQIIERIKVSVSTDQTSMELQLNPEHLGKVDLSIQSKNGVMTAQFVVQNEISKEAIESQLHTLRETLNSQGIKVEAIEVTVAAYTFQQNNGEGSDNQAEPQKKNNSRQISLEEAMNMTEASEEGSIADMTGIRGSQIDYTA